MAGQMTFVSLAVHMPGGMQEWDRGGQMVRALRHQHSKDITPLIRSLGYLVGGGRDSVGLHDGPEKSFHGFDPVALMSLPYRRTLCLFSVDFPCNRWQ
jgi:hypothetical protein